MSVRLTRKVGGFPVTPFNPITAQNVRSRIDVACWKPARDCIQYVFGIRGRNVGRLPLARLIIAYVVSCNYISCIRSGGLERNEK